MQHDSALSSLGIIPCVYLVHHCVQWHAQANFGLLIESLTDASCTLRITVFVSSKFGVWNIHASHGPCVQM